MDPVQALKSSRAQLELNAITGTYGHEEGDDDTNSEWDDVREVGVQPGQHMMQQNNIVPVAVQARQQQASSPPGESKIGIQSRAESVQEDPSASMLSGMLFQHLTESWGRKTQNSKSMTATLKDVLLATGIAMDDSEMDAPLDYVQETFAQLGLGKSPGKSSPSAGNGVSEADGCLAEAKGMAQDVCSSAEVPSEQEHGCSTVPQRLCPTQSPRQDTPSRIMSLNGVQNDSPQACGDSQVLSRLHTKSEIAFVDTASASDMLDETWDAPADVHVIRHAPQKLAATTAQVDSAQEQGQTNLNDSIHAFNTVPHSRIGSNFLRPDSLTQVAAAAAAAAAQAVKNESDCELSQFIKTILLQQTNLSLQSNTIAAGAPVAMDPNLCQSNRVRVPICTHQQEPTSVHACVPPTPPGYRETQTPQQQSTVRRPQACLRAAQLTLDETQGDEVSHVEQLAPGTAQTQLDLHSSQTAIGSSHEHCQPAAQRPQKGGYEGTQNDCSREQNEIEAENPKHHSACIPNRRRGRVSSTKAPASRPTTPAAEVHISPSPSLDGRVTLSPHEAQPQRDDRESHTVQSDDLALHSSFKVSVDAALATVRPDSGAVRPLLEIPQPDFAGQARSNLKRMLGDEVSYTEIKCTARSAATEAHNEFMAFKRAVPAAAPLVLTRLQPSWHSMEAMDDVAVFADACVQEVMLRAAQVQNDVSDGVYDLSNARARTVRSQAAARSLQQIVSKQKLAIAAYDEKDSSADAALQPFTVDSRENSKPQPKRGAATAAVVGETRQRANAGRRLGRVPAADERAVAGAPLQETMNVKRGDTDRAAQRAQAAYDRAVDRSRARPPVAFGRRLEDPAKSDARTDWKGNAQHAPENPAASGPSAVAGRKGKLSRPMSGNHSTASPPLYEMGNADQGHSGCSNEHEQSVRISKDRDAGQCLRGMSSDAPAADDHRSSAAHGSAHAPAVSPHTGGSTVADTALVALLQGLTEIIRCNSLAQPTVIIPPQPTWIASAAHQELHSIQCSERAAVGSANQHSPPHCKLEDATAAASLAPQQEEALNQVDPIRLPPLNQTSSAAWHTEGNGSMTAHVPASSSTPSAPMESVIPPPTEPTLDRHLDTNHRQHDTHPLSTISPASVWAAFRSRAPRKFLSVVDIVGSSTDQECSSDGGRTAGDHGDGCHKVDVAALEDLIAASTHASADIGSQPGAVQLTPEEATIIKAVVRDLSAAETRLSSGHDDDLQQNDEHTASYSELASRKRSESGLITRQSTLSDRSQSIAGCSNGSSHLSRSVTPTSGSVNPVPSHTPLEPGHMDAAPDAAEAPSKEHAIVHGHVGAELGEDEHNELLCCTSSGRRDGLAVMGNTAATPQQHVLALGNPCEGHRENKSTSEGSGTNPHQEAGNASMMRSVSSVAVQSARGTLQDRIKERYAELREQTKAALEDSDSCGSSPGRQTQPRALVLPRRRLSDSPNTPTDLSIASLSLDPSHAYPDSRPARRLEHPRCTQHSECSLEAGADTVNAPNTLDEIDAHTRIPGDQQISSQRPDDSLLHDKACIHDRMYGEENSATTPISQEPDEKCLADDVPMEKKGNAAVSTAVQDLLKPVESQVGDWKIFSARQGLEQYEELRCRLWRPPDDTQVYAAAVDYGRPSDVSGYCTEESSKFDSSSLCADPPVKQPISLDRSLLRRRRLDRLKRRLQQESSFATTTSFASSSDVTASMSHESDSMH